MGGTTMRFDFEAINLNMKTGAQESLLQNPHTATANPGEDFEELRSPKHGLWEFPPEPEAPFIYSARRMSLPPSIHRSHIAWIISDDKSLNRGYQELMHAYIHVTADRLAGFSPCYIELWRSYVPTMAFGPHGSGALLNAMVALAALHIAPLQQDPNRGRDRAARYYSAALKEYHDIDLKGQFNDAALATVLLFAHFEVFCSITH